MDRTAADLAAYVARIQYAHLVESQPLTPPDTAYVAHREIEGCEACPGDAGLSAEEMSGPCPWA